MCSASPLSCASSRIPAVITAANKEGAGRGGVVLRAGGKEGLRVFAHV